MPGSVRWEERRDLTRAAYDRQSRAADSAGLRALAIEVYETPSGIRYAGIWIENREDIPWRVFHGLTGTEYGEMFRNQQGYRLVDMEAYPTREGIRYAAIWYQSCDNSNWQQWRDMSRAAYQARADSLGNLGFQVIDFESYQASGVQRYAAIWERVSGRAWRVRTDQDLNGFLNRYRQYVDEGFRLIDFESYQTASGVRYGGIWAENEPRYRFALKAQLDDSIEAYRRTHSIPGMSVVVMRNDTVIYRRGFGWADSAARKEAHSGTVYLTASIAKVIGATIAARLEGRGVVDLSARTSSLLSYLPSYHTHTVEQLLAKAGCIGHYRESTEPDATRVYDFRRPALSQMWGDRMLPNCTPGTAYHYSTHGYTYVGAVLEEVTGDPIAEIITDELTRPFGLTTIRTAVSGTWGGFGALGVRPYNLARAYRWATRSRPINYENTTWKRLGGGLQTDALDLARFGHLTRLGRIADTTRLWTPIVTSATPFWDTTATGTVPTVGLAWVLGTANGSRRIAEHGGSARGARSHLRIYRDDGIVIAILTNQEETALTSAALNLSAGDPHPVRRLANTIGRVVFANPPP
jgi:CubicO group peptidase (beta-lactamase class C family)